MTGLLLLAALGIGWWAWRTRALKALRLGDVAAVVVVLIGLRLFGRGEVLPGLAVLGGAGAWLWFRRRGGGSAAAMTPERARAMLDLDRGASAADVRAAHRRLICRLHPDAGGSSLLSAEINAARDTLLATDGERQTF